MQMSSSDSIINWGYTLYHIMKLINPVKITICNKVAQAISAQKVRATAAGLCLRN